MYEVFAIVDPVTDEKVYVGFSLDPVARVKRMAWEVTRYPRISAWLRSRRNVTVEILSERETRIMAEKDARFFKGMTDPEFSRRLRGWKKGRKRKVNG